MRKATGRILALGMALLLLFPYAGAETAGEAPPDGEPPAGETAAETVQWFFDENGFLTGDKNPGEEYLLEDAENGRWEYSSRDLAIRVTRFREPPKEGSKKIREYCVADIHCSEASPLGVIMTDRGFYKERESLPGMQSGPGVHMNYPDKLMEAHPSILAVSDDMFGMRLIPVSKKKTKYDYHGVIIRNGEVLATLTRKSPEEGQKDKRNWPNMDTLAVYADGSMKTYVCDALTAEEYLEKSATQVFAFGPWLISGGKTNTGTDCYRDAGKQEPRVAIGMIEPYHYIIVATSGRPTDQYAGVTLDWLTEKMLEYGCTEALNLDGGQTVVMGFNNKVILKGDYGKKYRTIGSMIAFGLK